MILVKPSAESFGIEQVEDMLYALSKCCGERVGINESRRTYICVNCASEWPVFGTEDYPISKYRGSDGWASVMTQLTSPSEEGNRWWVSKWLGVPYEDVQLEIS